MLDEFGVAYHESTHAAVASHLGVAIREVSLTGTLQHGGVLCWDGSAVIDTSTLSPDVAAKIAVAGPIADLKYALVRSMCSNFEVTEDTAFTETRLDCSCSSGLAETLPAIRDLRDSNRMHVSATGRCGSHTFTHRVFLGDCYGDALEALSVLENDIGRLTAIITEVLSMVNTMEVSVFAIGLARALAAASPVTSVRKAVQDNHIRSLLDVSQIEKPS